MTETIKGGCLCGAVRYTATGGPALVGNCYCADCRKASGTSHCTRAFCPECGSALYSTNAAGMPGMIALRASSLDDPDAVTPQMSVYASSSPAWAQIDHSKPVFQAMPEGGPASVIKMD